MTDNHWCASYGRDVSWSKSTCILPDCIVETFQPFEDSAPVDLHVVINDRVDPIVIIDVHPESPEMKDGNLIAESRKGERLYTIPNALYWWTE